MRVRITIGLYTFKRVVKAGRDEKRDNSRINEHVVIGTAGSIFGKMEQRKLDCKNSFEVHRLGRG